MEKKVLLILAAGKSSRFGGQPKAFCQLGKRNVIQNTVRYACELYEKIYVAVSTEIYVNHKDVAGCEIFSIKTGHGDAHSLLRALKHVQKCEPSMNKVTICWGDAVIVDGTILHKTAEYSERLSKESVGIAVCSIDSYPYAWFEVRDGYIDEAYFAKMDGKVSQGIHDQSLFIFWMKPIIDYLGKYRESLGIADNEGWLPEEGSEMKLLNAFSFFNRNKMLPVQCCMVESGMVQSFNTRQELEKIKRKFHM